MVPKFFVIWSAWKRILSLHLYSGFVTDKQNSSEVMPACQEFTTQSASQMHCQFYLRGPIVMQADDKNTHRPWVHSLRCARHRWSAPRLGMPVNPQCHGRESLRMHVPYKSYPHCCSTLQLPLPRLPLLIPVPTFTFSEVSTHWLGSCTYSCKGVPSALPTPYLMIYSYPSTIFLA